MKIANPQSTMPNKQYIRGRKKEYKIVHDLIDQGCIIAQRTAGSHSPIDVFGINKDTKVIYLIQSKPQSYSSSKTRKIYEKLDYLTGLWTIKFLVL